MPFLLFTLLYLIIFGAAREVFIKKNIGTEKAKNGEILTFLSSMMAFWWPVVIPVLMGKALINMFFVENKEKI